MERRRESRVQMTLKETFQEVEGSSLDLQERRQRYLWV